MHIVCILGIILYHIYIQILVTFIVLQSFVVLLVFELILYELPRIYYEGQILLPMIIKTSIMIILGVCILRYTNGPNCMLTNSSLVI